MIRIKRQLALAILPLLVVSLLCDTAAAASKSKTTSLILIPARRRVVKLFQDVCRRRRVTLISYQSQADGQDPILYEWNGHAWATTSLMDLADNLSSTQTILVGNQATLPTALLDATRNIEGRQILESLDIVSLITSLDAAMDFNSRELKWLAKRHGMTITDLNAERRKYGRYGKPGEKQSVMPPVETTAEHETVVEVEVLAPVDIEEEPAVIDIDDLPTIEKGSAPKAEATPEMEMLPEDK